MLKCFEYPMVYLRLYNLLQIPYIMKSAAFRSFVLLVLFVTFFMDRTVYAQTGTFTEYLEVNCNTDTTIKGLGYPTWVIPVIVKKPSLGFAIIESDGIYSALRYTAAPCVKGNDTIIVSCARATQIQCDTGIYIFTISCNEVIDYTISHALSCRDSASTYLSGFGVAEIIEGPNHGKARIDRGLTDLDSLVYYPDSSYQGLDYIKLSLFGGAIRYLLIYQIECKLPNASKNIDENEELVIYPNPVKDFFFIKRTELSSLIGINLVNALGVQLNVKYDVIDGGVLIDVNRFPPGRYSVIIREKSRIKSYAMLIAE